MSNQKQNKKQLHLTFVEMLFALAIGQVAIDVSKLIDYQLMSNQTFLAVVPAYSHLLLAAVVISTSWVGWRSSVYSGSDIKSVFTLDYVELFIDVIVGGDYRVALDFYVLEVLGHLFLESVRLAV